jgi:hypothetical protein
MLERVDNHHYLTIMVAMNGENTEETPNSRFFLL